MPRDLVVLAWDRGYDAGTRLLPADRNPYKVDSKLYKAWEDGWRNGIDPDLEDANSDYPATIGPLPTRRYKHQQLTVQSVAPAEGRMKVRAYPAKP